MPTLPAPGSCSIHEQEPTPGALESLTAQKGQLAASSDLDQGQGRERFPSLALGLRHLAPCLGMFMPCWEEGNECHSWWRGAAHISDRELQVAGGEKLVQSHKQDLLVPSQGGLEPAGEKNIQEGTLLFIKLVPSHQSF